MSLVCMKLLVATLRHCINSKPALKPIHVCAKNHRTMLVKSVTDLNTTEPTSSEPNYYLHKAKSYSQ